MKQTLLLLLTMLLCGAAQAQSNDSLVVLWLSDPGLRPAGIVLGESDMRIYDASGDGQPDLILTREDDQGNIQDLRVIDGLTREVIWGVQDIHMNQGIFVQIKFWGFADPFGSGTRYAVFTSDADVALVDPRDDTIVWYWSASNSGSVRFLGAADLTGDGFEELIIFLPDTRQVQVWTDLRPN